MHVERLLVLGGHDAVEPFHGIVHVAERPRLPPTHIVMLAHWNLVLTVLCAPVLRVPVLCVPNLNMYRWADAVVLLRRRRRRRALPRHGLRVQGASQRAPRNPTPYILHTQPQLLNLIYIHIYEGTHTHTHTYIYIYNYNYIHTYIYIYICIYIYMYIHRDICMFVYVFINIY